MGELDTATMELCAAMPREVRAWGLARKALNIFLRECLYTSYLRDASRLDRSEHYLELPLDSLTGRHYSERRSRCHDGTQFAD